jgi:flagellar motor switch protein FliM
MSKILTQAEIDLLLGSAADVVARRTGDGETLSVDSDVMPYNFRRPDRVSKEQIRALHLLHDRFARNLTTSLSAYLRSVTEVSLVSVEQGTYAEFLAGVPDPTSFYAISMAPLDGLAALELNPQVAFTFVDRMLGGAGRGAVLSRALTEIEQNVVDGLVKVLLENLTDAWRSVVEVDFAISGRETRPQMLQVGSPTEVVVLLGFEVRVGDTRGLLTLCIPASAIDAVRARFSRGLPRSTRQPSEADRQRLREALARVPLPVSATLDAAVPARDLVSLRPGDVLSLGRAAGQPVDVRVAGSVKFGGRLVVRGGHTAVVTQPSGVEPAALEA